MGCVCSWNFIRGLDQDLSNQNQCVCGISYRGCSHDKCLQTLIYVHTQDFNQKQRWSFSGVRVDNKVPTVSITVESQHHYDILKTQKERVSRRLRRRLNRSRRESRDDEPETCLPQTTQVNLSIATEWVLYITNHTVLTRQKVQLQVPVSGIYCQLSTV